MVKKLFYVFMALLFICAFTITTTPVYAQEEEEEIVEDVADISLEDLLNVEITTAGKQAEKISEIPASVVLVTRKDIETYGYQSLQEVLESIPGLYMVDDYLDKGFGVRGFWTLDPNKNFIILVNDVPQTEYLLNSNSLSLITIPVEAIDRVEVVRGPMSVIYGAGAFFGTINIFTNKPEDKAVSQVAAAGGSEKTYKLFVRAAGKTEDLQYAFNGSYFDTEGFDVPFNSMGDPANQALYGIAAGSTTGELLERSEKNFNFSGNFKGVSFDASYGETEKEIFALLPSADGDGTQLFYQSFRLNFGYEHNFSEKAKAAVKFGYYYDKWEFDWDIVLPTLYGIQINGAAGYRAEFNLFFNPTPKLNITLGASYNNVLQVQNNVNVPLFGLVNRHNELAEGESIVTQSLFTQINWKLLDRFKIVLGARMEQVPEYTMQRREGVADPTNPLFGTFTLTQGTYSQKDWEFIPRVALIWGINENNYIKFLYGKAITRPSFFQNIEIIEGASALQPEEIQTFELNYIGNLSPKFIVNLSVFHNILDQLIYRTLFTVEGAVVSYYSNSGEVQTTGVELTLNAAIAESFKMELSGTYQDTKDQRPGFENIDVGYAPKFLGYIKASYFFNDDISLAVTGNYVGEMESFYDDTLSPPARLGDTVDGYFVLGANLRVRNMFGSGLFLNIRGSNLLDQEYRYPTTANSNLYITRGTLGRGMSLLVTLGYRFIPMPMPQPKP